MRDRGGGQERVQGGKEEKGGGREEWRESGRCERGRIHLNEQIRNPFTAAR